MIILFTLAGILAASGTLIIVALNHGERDATHAPHMLTIHRLR